MPREVLSLLLTRGLSGEFSILVPYLTFISLIKKLLRKLNGVLYQAFLCIRSLFSSKISCFSRLYHIIFFYVSTV